MSGAASLPQPIAPGKARQYARGWRNAALVLVVIALAALPWMTYRQLRDAVHSPSWPTTRGTVVVSSVDREWNAREGEHYYDLHIWYTYVVGGREYRGTAVTFGRHRAGPDYMYRIKAKYPIGSSVSVYYDSRDPSRAVLEPGLDRTGLLNSLGATLFFELCFLLPALALCLISARYFDRLARV